MGGQADVWAQGSRRQDQMDHRGPDCMTMSGVASVTAVARVCRACVDMSAVSLMCVECSCARVVSRAP
eukprot:517346-Prymnesium_polylepis.1